MSAEGSIPLLSSLNTTDKGRLGEVKVLARLVELGWYPFTDISGKCPVDILAWKDGRCISLQVKCCDYMQSKSSYAVQLGSVRPNRTTNVIKRFDNSSVDYLSVYFPTPDKVCFFRAEDLTVGRSLSVREENMHLYGSLS